MLRTLLLAGALLGVAALPSPAPAQVRASERATVSQTVDGTTLSLDYSRPMARGRSDLFGKVVHWGEVWTPGANWATTLEVNRDVQVNGKQLAKGKYSVWMIPRQGDWSVLFHPEARRFHTNRPDTTKAVLRLAVKPEAAAHLEGLTWSFPSVTREGATLQMQWGTTVVPLAVRVTPTKQPRLSAAEGKEYIGGYEMRFDKATRTMRLEVYEEKGLLRARVTPAMPGTDGTLDLIPTGEGTFQMGIREKGELVEVSPEYLLVFRREGGSVRGFELIGLDQKVSARGERKP